MSDDMAILDERLNLFLPQDAHMQPLEADFYQSIPAFPSDYSLPTGWRLLDSSSQWHPCPVGVYVGPEMISGTVM
jgi:ribosomal biogenesis protein LAS1